jgi:predicted outer membrane repeat protein
LGGIKITKLVRISALILIAVLILPMALSVITPNKAFANGGLPDVYVNGTTGNDGYDGSSPTLTGGSVGPKKTIGNAIGFVATNGTIHVAAGTYHEHSLHLSETMNLVGAGALTTILDGDASGYVLQVSSAPYQRNTISGFTIQNGAPSGSDPGGGIYISTAHIVTINDCAIINNTKGPGSGLLPGLGGGVCNDGGTLYMNRCTVSGNTATDYGGGIYTQQNAGGDSGLVELTNCTISGNTVTGNSRTGGGIYCAPNATMRLLNVTIANNRATGQNSMGGGYSDGSVSSMYFKNCIVANNTAGLSDYNNGYQSLGTGIHSLGYNIDSENKAISHYFNEATDQWNVNPQLGLLQNNGGPTSTHAITASSPAFNRGTNDGAPATDQRGIIRPQGSTCDIGAFEFAQQTAQVATATGTGTATFTTSGGSITGLTATASTTCGALSGFTFPHGFFSFNINGISSGSTVTITITLPSNMPTNTQYWKCINGQWVNVTSIMGDNNGDNVLTLAITDGGLGDADGVANGIIVDPGTPAIPATAPRRSGSSSSSPQMPQQFISAPANLSVKYLNVQPPQATANQPVTVYANIANSGDEAGNYTAILKINGQIEETRTGKIGGHIAVPLQFITYKDKPGTYNVDINGQQTSFMIVGKSEDTDVSRMVLLSGFFTCAIGVIVVLGLLIRRKLTD